jgi:hypothetical protein
MIALDTPVMGTDNSKAQDQRWCTNYYIMKLVHRVNLDVDTAMYYQDLVISPKGPGHELPANGNLAGADSRTGEMKDFKYFLER